MNLQRKKKKSRKIPLPDLITVSEEASEFIYNLFQINSIPSNYYFRITAHGKVGEIIEYKFGFDSTVNPDDKAIILPRFNLIVDSETLYNIEGSTINFKGNKESGELIFDNPFINLTNHDKCKH